MSARYNYFSYENLPCRVELKAVGIAEIYNAGIGFVTGPKMTILSEGRPISKSEFDAMIIAIAKSKSVPN